MKFNSFLRALQDQRRFIIARTERREDGRLDKIPTDPITGYDINHLDPARWMTPAEALLWLEGAPENYGLGIVLGNGIACIDIDHAWLPDRRDWSPLCYELCERFAGAAIDVSVSGTGRHIIASHTGLPAHRCKNKEHGTELYEDGRFIYLGTQFVGDPRLDCTAQFVAAINQYFLPPPPAPATQMPSHGPVAAWSGPTDDAELIATLTKMRPTASAVFGSKATFTELWEAQTDKLSWSFPSEQPHAAYDESSADLALANRLAWATGNDVERITRLMLQSKLYREKYERVDYLPRTIAKACAAQSTWYNDGRAPSVSVALASTAPALPKAPSEKPPGYLTAVECQQIFTGCIYVQDQNGILMPPPLSEVLDHERFNAHFGGHTFQQHIDGQKPAKKAWDAFVYSSVTRYPRVRGVIFDPRKPSGQIVTRDGLEFVNTWVELNIPHYPGDVTWFIEHVKRLYPEGRDAKIIINYLKFMVQYRGHKAQWAPFLQGVEGNGKSFISSTMMYCLGRRYSQPVRADQIDSRFNSQLYGKLFAPIEDVKISDDRSALWETLKPMITQDFMEIEGKNLNAVNKEICFNFIFNSNHRDGIRKTANDRRVAPFFAAQQHKPDKERDGLTKPYFMKMWQHARGDGWPNVLDYLKNTPFDAGYELETYFGDAPDTYHTNAAIGVGFGNAEQEIVEAIEAGISGFRGGWVSSTALDYVLRQCGKDKVFPRNRRRELVESLGFYPHPGLPGGRVPNPLADGTRPVLYCMARSRHWGLRGKAVITAYLDDQD